MFQLIHLNTSCLLVCGLFGLLFVNELLLQHDLSAGCKFTPCVRSIVSPWARSALSVDFSNACHCCTANLKASTMFFDIFADVSMKLDMLNSWHQIETASGVTSRLAGDTSFWKNLFVITWDVEEMIRNEIWRKSSLKNFFYLVSNDYKWELIRRNVSIFDKLFSPLS